MEDTPWGDPSQPPGNKTMGISFTNSQQEGRGHSRGRELEKSRLRGDSGSVTEAFGRLLSWAALFLATVRKHRARPPSTMWAPGCRLSRPSRRRCGAGDPAFPWLPCELERAFVLPQLCSMFRSDAPPGPKKSEIT